MESKQLVFHQNEELSMDKTNIINNTRDHQLFKKGQKKAINIKISFSKFHLFQRYFGIVSLVHCLDLMSKRWSSIAISETSFRAYGNAKSHEMGVKSTVPSL